MEKKLRFLFASDSFKGTLSSADTARLLDGAAREVFGKDGYEARSVPVADGGEGTVDAVTAACGGDIVTAEARDPLGRPVKARYGMTKDAAVIEMAEASGLTLVEPELRDPMETTSFGTGELILDALDRGAKEISIAIGGSATNDGGTGCLRALGVRLLDGDGKELEGRGRDLGSIRSIDMSGLDPRVENTKITVMSDVTNPLCGPDGASMVFGPQKGADPETVEKLEAGMENYRDVIKKQFGTDCDEVPGAGAAGGLGAALCVILGGEMKSGIDTVLDMIGFGDLLDGVDIIVTGEGRTDRQSCFGKVMKGVGEYARAKGVKAVGLVGSLGEGYEEIYGCGISALYVTKPEDMTTEEAMERAEELYSKAAAEMFRALKEDNDGIQA